MRSVPAEGHPPFAAGRARLGRRKLVRRALGMRPLATLTRNLLPLCGIKSRKAPRPLLFHASLPDSAKETSPAGKAPVPNQRRVGASRELQLVPGLHVIGP